MSRANCMTGIEMLTELQATHAELHTDDYVAMSIFSEPIIGGNAAAETLSGPDNATGVLATEDNLFWIRNGEKQWLRRFGFYHEAYASGADDRWRFSYRKLERTHAETSPGAAIMAADYSGENSLVGIG